MPRAGPGRSARVICSYDHKKQRRQGRAFWRASRSVRRAPARIRDDASRRITGAAPFRESALETTVMMPRRAITKFGVPSSILPDNVSRFVGKRGQKEASP